MFVLRRHALVIGVAALVAVSVGACGSSSSKSSSSSGSATSASASASASAGAGAKEAQAFLSQYLKPAKAIYETQPLKKVPRGSTWVYMSCNELPCQEVGVGLKAAAEALGVKLTTIPYDVTPAGISAAWDQAVSDKPDVAMMGGSPVDLFSRQCAAAKAQGTKVIVWSATSTPKQFPCLTANTNSTGPYTTGAKIQAAAIISQGGSPQILTLDTPDFPAAQSFGVAFKAAAAKWCPACKVHDLVFKETDIGTMLPAAVVSALQQNPGVKWVVAPFGSVLTGVEAAVKAAGISGVQYISNAGNADDYQRIESGEQYGDVGVSDQYFGWYQADTIARIEAGQTPVYRADGEVDQSVFLTKKNLVLNSKGDWNPVPNYQAQFEKLWGVS